MEATYCQQCGQVFGQVQLMPISRAEVNEALSDSRVCHVWVWIKCPRCGFELLAYDSRFTDRDYALDQVRRMMESVA